MYFNHDIVVLWSACWRNVCVCVLWVSSGYSGHVRFTGGSLEVLRCVCLYVCVFVSVCAECDPGWMDESWCFSAP